MNLNVTHSINVDNDTRNIVEEYIKMEADKKKTAEKHKPKDSDFLLDDDNGLVFRICSSSGTKINIPANIIKGGFSILVGLSVASLIVKTIEIIASSKK